MIEAFFIENDQFSRFSTEHFIVLIVGCITAAVLIFWGRRASEDRQVAIGAVMGYGIFAAYFVMFISIDAARNGFDPGKHLPLAMCNVCGVTFWLVLHKKKLPRLRNFVFLGHVGHVGCGLIAGYQTSLSALHLFFILDDSSGLSDRGNVRDVCLQDAANIQKSNQIVFAFVRLRRGVRDFKRDDKFSV